MSEPRQGISASTRLTATILIVGLVLAFGVGLFLVVVEDLVRKRAETVQEQIEKNPQAVKELGAYIIAGRATSTKFVEHLAARDYDAAHALLHPGMHESLPLEKFRKMMTNESYSGFKSVRWIRIKSRPELGDVLVGRVERQGQEAFTVEIGYAKTKDGAHGVVYYGEPERAPAEEE